MKILKVFIPILIILLLCGCTKKSNDELIMVTEAGFAPYEFYQNGEVVGVDIDIAREIAKSMNKTLIVKDIAFDSIINEINSGKADFGAAGMSITEERKKMVDFTITYTTSNQVVVVKNDSTIKSFNDLTNKRISVQLGTTADSYVSDNYKNATIIRQKKYLSAAEDVKNNKSDCIIMDSLPATELVKENPELKILDGYLFSDSYGMVVKKDNTKLLNQINKVLKKLIKEGKIDEYIINYSK
jgi:arginine/lysine/histidine transporter system substrate-binding protein